MNRGEVLHLLVFLLVCFVAFYRAELPQKSFKDRNLVLELDRGYSVDERGISASVKVLHSSEEKLTGKRAFLKLYGAVELPFRVVSLEGSVRVKGSRVFINSSYKKVRSLHIANSPRDTLMSRYSSKTESVDVRGTGLAFLFGEGRSVLTESLNRALNSTNLAHLLVVSGLHVGMIVLLLSKSLPVPYGYPLALVGVSLYVLWVVPDNPPVLRAYIMAVVFILALISYRKVNSFATLLFSGSVILTLYPNYLFSYSFWLSFFATLYIILSLKDVGGGFWSKSFTASLSAFTGVSPLLSTFASVSPMSIILTPFMLPIAFLYSALGMLSLITLFSFEPVMEAFNLVGRIFVFAVDKLSLVSFSLYPSMGLYEAVVLSLLGAAGLIFMRNKLIPCGFVLLWLTLRAIL